MAQRETVQQSGRFSKSVGAGMKSLFAGGGRTYYILEHKVSSDKHHAGEHQEIIIDYIELGRDSKCQVRFGDSFPTVSGRHAAITKEGNNWVLKNLSSTNPTLINGSPVAKQFFLKNGDEIQLSMEGPKLGFLVPVQNSVKSIGMTRRLSLFGQQALRPYKQALTAISLVFVLALGGLGYSLWQQNEVIEDQSDILKEQTIALDEMIANMSEVKGNADSLRQVIAANTTTQDNLKRKLRQIEAAAAAEAERRRNAPPPVAVAPSAPAMMSLDPLFPSVYYIEVAKIVITYQGQTETVTNHRWSGTGFLLNNKTFVTARHVIEAWFFLSNEDQFGMQLNMYSTNGGTVVAHFVASSPDGSRIRFKSTDFTFDRSTDQDAQTNDNQGNQVMLRKAGFDGTDWATYSANKAGVLTANKQAAQSLAQGVDLHILGYPLGIGADSPTDISPLYSVCPTAQAGLHGDRIRITGRSFDHGNSGGPVFWINSENKYEVVGIISAGIGESIGFIIPISAIR